MCINTFTYMYKKYTGACADTHLKCFVFVIIVGTSIEMTSDLKVYIDP